MLRFIPGAAANTWASTESADTLKRIAASDPDAVSWELHRQQDDSRETYDHNGKLLKITARNGWASRLVYDDAGRLQAVYNAFRRQLRLQYDANGWLAAITTPDANVTRLSHDPQGNLLAITWPDGNVKRYHYEDSRFPRALTGITDETGQRIGSYTYDAQGRVIETQRAGGVDRLQFSYGQDASGAPQTTITDFGSGAPSSRTHRFALQGRVLRPAGASAPCPLCGNTAQAIAYDSVGRKLREVQHDGSVVFHQYNARGQETERASFPASFASASTRPALSHASAVTTTEWHGTWNLPTRVAEPGRISTYAYSASGVTAHTTQATSDLTGAAGFNAAPSGALQRTETLYSAQSLPQRISEFSDGVLGQRWDYGYSPQGDLVSVTDAMAPSQSATLEHDGNGRLSRLIASNGAQASFTANSRGQMTAAYTPGGNITYVHDARNLINEIRFSDGRWVRYSYSPAQQLIEIRDSSGLVEQIASSDTEGLDPQRLMQRVAQWLSDRGDRIAQMLLPPVHANPVLVLVPAGVVLGIMSVAEANRLNAAGIPGSNAAGCGANCQGGAGQSASASGSIPSVAGIGWLTQVGIVLSGQSQASSVPSPPTYDKAGLLVSPQSCVPPPGNCTPNDHRQLQDQVDQWCKAVPRACRAGMVRSELNERLENGRACGTARDKLNKKCFAGGDADHRNEAAKAWKAVANCESILSKLP